MFVLKEWQIFCGVLHTYTFSGTASVASVSPDVREWASQRVLGRLVEHQPGDTVVPTQFKSIGNERYMATRAHIFPSTEAPFDFPRPRDARSVSKEFMRKTKRLGFPIRFHNLRATHETLLLNAGVPVHVAAARCGHDPAVLLRVYAKRTKKAGTSAAKVIGALSNGAFGNYSGFSAPVRQSAVANSVDVGLRRSCPSAYRGMSLIAPSKAARISL